jgi:hypothetical protein
MTADPAVERASEAPQDALKPAGISLTPLAYGEGTPWRHITLAQLIESGLVRVPLEVERRYRGVVLKARIESADRIVVGNNAFDSLSTAGGIARKPVPGSPTHEPFPQTNGWTFWEYRLADGTRHRLDALRQELHARRSLGSKGVGQAERSASARTVTTRGSSPSATAIARASPGDPIGHPTARDRSGGVYGFRRGLETRAVQPP